MPEESDVRPEGATSTPRAEEESTQMMSKTLYEEVQSDIRNIRNRLAEVEADNRRRGKFRLREVFLASILVATPLSALFSVLFSWVLSPDGVTIDIDFVGYFGLVAIVITLIGATVFFYVALLTVQRNTEARAVRTELDEQRKEIQEIKELADQEKESE